MGEEGSHQNTYGTGFGTVMNEFPRLAVATSAEGAEPSVACLAMLAGLTERRWRVQHFRTRACPTATEAVGQVTGLPGRHLDAWLMPPAVCRGLFARAAVSAELSIVEGTLGEAKSSISYTSCDTSGRLASDCAGAGSAGGRGGLMSSERVRSRCTYRGCRTESTRC